MAPLKYLCSLCCAAPHCLPHVAFTEEITIFEQLTVSWVNCTVRLRPR